MKEKQARSHVPKPGILMKGLEYRGYLIVQSIINNHVVIRKSGWIVYHTDAGHILSDDELRQMVDDYIHEVQKGEHNER